MSLIPFIICMMSERSYPRSPVILKRCFLNLTSSFITIESHVHQTQEKPHSVKNNMHLFLINHETV